MGNNYRGKAIAFRCVVENSICIASDRSQEGPRERKLEYSAHNRSP